MLAVRVNPSVINRLQVVFGARLRDHVSLARYTSSRVGGEADWFLEVQSADELAEVVRLLWQVDLPYVILGGGSNVLVSDAGVHGVVLLNRGKQVRFDIHGTPPTVWAESGANLGLLARQAAQRGLSGLEWASGIPGTLGGAVVGNAGAHGADIAGSLRLAEILHRLGKEQYDIPKREQWVPDQLELAYRTSLIKRQPGRVVVLNAVLELKRSKKDDVQAKMDQFSEYRHRTQPPGASMGSMFKNPPNDFAGRLIDAAGLKGTRIGDAEISNLHGNFFINKGQANAQDVFSLIQLARKKVLEASGIELELEIELVGEW